jgi:hypothetical protein
LKSGISASQAEASLNLLADQLAKEYPDSNEGQSIKLGPPGFIIPELRGAVVSFTWVLMAAVALVLLVTCTNLAVCCSRARPIDVVRLRFVWQWVRAAFGLIRQLLIESLLLSIVGGAAGLMLAIWIVKALLAFKPPIDFPLTLDLGLDWRVMLFSLGVSVVAGRCLVWRRRCNPHGPTCCTR